MKNKINGAYLGISIFGFVIGSNLYSVYVNSGGLRPGACGLIACSLAVLFMWMAFKGDEK